MANLILDSDTLESEQHKLLHDERVGGGRQSEENYVSSGLEDGFSPRLPQPGMGRIFAAMFSFLVIGMNSATVGIMIPHLEAYYHINDTIVSIIFLMPLTGYIVASLSNSTIHSKLGRRGIATIGASCQLLFLVVVSLHPRWIVILLTAVIAGFGVGLIDAGWCAWAGGMPNANTISGFLHGSYSIGATVGPYFATYLLSGAKLPWYTFYYAMACAGTIELIALTYTFRHDSGLKYLSEKSTASSKEPTSTLKDVLKTNVLWILAAYFLSYVGAEAATAGWIYTFMRRARSATPYVAGFCTSGFWAGHSVGRITLGIVTEKFGERLSVIVYLLLALGFELLFSLAPNNVVSIVATTLLGFFLGPLFPTGIVMLTRLLPRDLHVSAVAAVAAVGQLGGAVFPFAVGAMAQAWGIGMLQPFIFVLLLLALAFWLAVPRVQVKKQHQDGERDGESESLLRRS